MNIGEANAAQAIIRAMPVDAVMGVLDAVLELADRSSRRLGAGLTGADVLQAVEDGNELVRGGCEAGWHYARCPYWASDPSPCPFCEAVGR